MRYTARAVTASASPWPLQIGTRTYLARPLSAALVLRLFPQMTNGETRTIAIAEALRAAFPVPSGWCASRRDPMRANKTLPPKFVAEVIARLFALPGHDADAEDDPEAALIAAHRRMAFPDEAKTSGPTLTIAALTCEREMGADWYFNPARWSTVDGFAPLATVWTTYTGLSALAAKERLSMATAVRLGMADGDKADRAWRKLEAQAYPADPTMRGATRG